MIFDVKITQSELNISSEIVSDKSLHFVVDFPIWIKGEKGDPFTYADFTAEQIKQLQQPAFEAATLANEATDKANTVSDKVIVIEGTVIKNEDKRIVNENTRIENEKERSDGFSSAITLIGNKVEAAEKATTDATDAAKNAQETASHPTYIGDDHYVYRWDATEKEYYRTDIYSKGDTGLSAYEYAVRGGYKGTEAQFIQEQVDIIGNGDRLAAVESEKADLGNDGYVLPEQINPLHGKQTGYIHTGSTGTYGSATMITPAASLTYELLMDAVKIEHPTGIIVLNTSNLVAKAGRSIYLYWNQIYVWYNNASTYVGFNVSPLFNGMTHLVVTYDYENKVISILLNGQFYTKSVPNLIVEQTTGFYLARTTYNTNSPTYQNRIFNKVLSVSEMLALWNNGNPQNYRGIDKTSLVAEYIPEYLSSDNWIDSSDNGNDLQAIGSVALTYGYNSSNGTYKGSSLTPLFVARGAVFNDKTGYYELNGLTDITEAQMMNIYNYTSNFMPIPYALRGNKMIRTNYTPTGGFWQFNGDNLFANSVIEIANLTGVTHCMDATNMFNNTPFLKKILGVINVGYNNTTPITGIFNKALLLEDVKIAGIKNSMYIGDSPNFNIESVLYLINNSANTAPITLTLHPTAKARLTPEDIALASSKNITIA